LGPLASKNLIDDVFSVHLQVLTFLVQGKSFDWIAKKFTDDFRQNNYLEMVKTSGLLSFDENEKLIGAYPISPLKTKYQVTIEGIGSGYAMCAIDALGVAYTFNAKTNIHSVDHATNEPLQITVDPNSDTQHQYDIVVTYKPKCQGKSAATDQCPAINFYSSSNPIPSDVEGDVLSFQEALNHAQSVFSPSALKNCLSAGKLSPLSDYYS
jgi:hypothetical protein